VSLQSLIKTLTDHSAVIASGTTDLDATQVRRLMKSIKAYTTAVAWHPKERGDIDGVDAAISVVQELMKALGKQPQKRDANASTCR
jgi:hypothetical protein